MEAINVYAELDNRPSKSGLAPIVIRFDNARNEHIGRDKIKMKISPADWDFKARRIKESNPSALFMNRIIQYKIDAHNGFIFRRQAFKLPVNKKIIEEYLKMGGGFESFYKHASHILETKVFEDGGGYNQDTKRRYSNELERMQKYQPELFFSDITQEWLTGYKNWMQTVYKKKDGKKMHKNGIWKALSVVRMFYNEAARRKIFLAEENPFLDFKVGAFETDETKIKWLNVEQLDMLEAVLLDMDMQELTRNVGWRFLAMCVSGMRISDAMLLDEMKFNDSGDLQFKPHKTRRHDNVAHIPITTVRQRRYFTITLQRPLPGTNAKTFRTTFNIHLKILAAMAGITINLTSHVGRHTLGGLLVDADVSEESSKKILGVKSNKTIQTYRHLKENKLRNEAGKLNSIL